MGMRRVFAELWVNDNEAEACGMGTIDYLDSVIESASLSAIELRDVIIADDDECDDFEAYRNYVAEWAVCITDDCNSSPMTFEEWREYCE